MAETLKKVGYGLVGSWGAIVANPKWWIDVGVKYLDEMHLEDRLKNSGLEPIASMDLGRAGDYLYILSPGMLTEKLSYSALLAAGYLKAAGYGRVATGVGAAGVIGALASLPFNLERNKGLDDIVYSFAAMAASYGAGYGIKKASSLYTRFKDYLKDRKKAEA